MNKLLADAIDAHGGMEQWKKFVTLEMDYLAGGQILEIKKVRLREASHIVIDLQEQANWTTSAVAPNNRIAFRPDRMAIETKEGKVLAERLDPRSSFLGHGRDTPWDIFHVNYFAGYAIWSYFSSPFSLATEGAQVWDIEPLEEDGELWQGIRVVLPSRFATHSRAQEFYFGEDMLLRRHDYTLDIADAFRVANYGLDNVDINGIKFASKRRAYLCNKKYDVLRDKLYISLDMSNFRLNERRDATL